MTQPEDPHERAKRLFRRLDDEDFQILCLWDGPATRYQVWKRTKPRGGMNPAIPRSTFYRRINEKLVPLGFLEEIAREDFEKGILKLVKPVLSLTVFKGVIASAIYSSHDVGDLEGWVRWLLQFNMDLSEVNVDPKFYLWTVLFAAGDHPEWFPPHLRSIGERVRQNFEEPNKITMDVFRKGFTESYQEQRREKTAQTKSANR